MIGDIFKEMRRQLVGETKGIVGLPTGTEGWAGWGTSVRTDFQSLSREGYEKNALINACVNELASSASEAKLVVEQKRGKEWIPNPDHGLQILLDDPNPLMSAYEFWFNTIMYLSIAGKCFWEMEPSGAGRIVGLWLMRPDLVEIEAMRVKLGERTRKKIAGFRWLGLGEGSITFPSEGVLYFKHPHPRDEIEGFPPLAAAARDGDTDNFATDFVQSFFKNAAVPFGIFKMKGYQDEAMIAQAKAKLKAMYGGPAQMWHDPLFLGEESEWVQMGSTFTDMDFPQLRRITESRICAVFQVPPILVGAFVGLEKGSLGTPAYTMARKSFWMETLMPAYKKNAGIINRQLAPLFGKDVRVVWDFSEVEALQEEQSAVFTRANDSIAAGWVTVNEARNMAGLEEVPAGDVFLRPMMLLPVSAEEKPPPPGAKALELKGAHVPEEAKERWAKAIDMVAQAWEGIFKKTAGGRFKAEKEALLKILRKEGKATKQGDPFEKFLEEGTAYLMVDKEVWVEEFNPLFAGVMEAQADNILAAYGISFDINRPEVQEFLKAYTFEFAKGIEGVSEKGLRELVAEAQREGWSVPTLRKAIEEDTGHYYDKVRSTRIARTETIRSSNAGAEEAWKHAGIEYKQWYATLDGRQCPECEAEYEYSKDNPTIMGGLFRCGLAYPTLHPNCRCTILAYFE